jgi:hypothetical protein
LKVLLTPMPSPKIHETLSTCPVDKLVKLTVSGAVPLVGFATKLAIGGLRTVVLVAMILRVAVGIRGVAGISVEIMVELGITVGGASVGSAIVGTVVAGGIIVSTGG